MKFQYINLFFKFFLSLTCFLFILFILPEKGYAEDSFKEEFNGYYSEDVNWAKYQNQGQLQFTSDVLKLIPATSGSPNSFPYLYTLGDVFPPDDFKISFLFKYNSVGPNGNGVVISNNPPPNGSSYGPANVIFGFQQDSSTNWSLDTTICPEVNPNCTFPPYKYFQTSSPELTNNLIEIIYSNKKYSIYKNGNLLFRSSETTKRPISVAIGNPRYMNTALWSSFEIDYLYIESLEPEEPGLNVPYFSQKDPLWGEHQYDFASQWAPVGKTGIKNWGCTMTSACMVMKYHGINKLPDGGELNPDTVNSWLISQGDGYVNGGLLNWIALTRLAKLSNQAQGSTKLEFVRKSYAIDKVKKDLEDQKPVILQEPGHFIVVRGEKDGNTWLINDPYTKTRGEVVKTSTFYTANTFRPSSTNLSAIMLIVDPTLDLLITNPEGSRSGKLAGQVFDEIPDVLIAQEGPIVNPEDGSSQSGSANILTFMQPANGEYTIIISSPNTQMVSAKGFVYDQNGEPVEIILSGIASLGNPAEFIIDFSQTEPSIIKPKNVDFDKLIDDINILFKLKEIKNSSLKRLLLNLTRQAKFFTEKDHKWGKRMARHFLSLEMEIIKKQEGKLITPMGASILREEIKVLKESLG